MLPVRQTIVFVDANSVRAAQSTAAVDQYRLEEAYVGANVENWQLTFGKQSLCWGPGEGGPLLFSDNAEPIYMFRASRIVPLRLPWVLQFLGPAEFDVFFGQLAGNAFPPRPLIQGEKSSVKPTPNLGVGSSRTVETGRGGRAITLPAPWHTVTS